MIKIQHQWCRDDIIDKNSVDIFLVKKQKNRRAHFSPYPVLFLSACPQCSPHLSRINSLVFFFVLPCVFLSSKKVWWECSYLRNTGKKKKKKEKLSDIPLSDKPMAHMHSFLPVRSVYSFSKYQSMLYFLLKTFIIIDSFELKLKELQWGLSSTLFLLLITVLFWTRYLFQRTHIIPFSVPISLIIYFILFLLFLCPHLPPI